MDKQVALAILVASGYVRYEAEKPQARAAKPSTPTLCVPKGHRQGVKVSAAALWAFKCDYGMPNDRRIYKVQGRRQVRHAEKLLDRKTLQELS